VTNGREQISSEKIPITKVKAIDERSDWARIEGKLKEEPRKLNLRTSSIGRGGV
jgi:hypothetical protein